MRLDVCRDLSKCFGQGGLVVGFDIKPAAFARSVPEQGLAGMKANGVGDDVVLDFFALERVDVRAQVDVVEGSCYVAQGLALTAGGVIAKRRRAVTVSVAVGEQDDEILLAVVTDWRLQTLATAPEAAR